MINPKEVLAKATHAASQSVLKLKIKRPFNIAIVGATGVVGRETLAILQEREFPVAQLRLLASERSAGEKLEFDEDEHVVHVLKEDSFKDIDVAFFCAGGSISKKYAPLAAAQGAVCIDKSSHFRMDEDVPLVVPEVNPEALSDYKKKRIIASPNCSTIPLMQILKPLHDTVGVQHVVASTYQAVSGAGKSGIKELETQVRDMFNMREVDTTVFKRRIAFNVLPMIPAEDAMDEDGMTTEESKMVNESRKILNLPELRISVTCARVPVFNGHSEAVHIGLKGPLTMDRVRDLLSAAPGIVIIDDPEKGIYPTPEDAAGEDMTLVGRIRPDSGFDHGIALWFSCDNLRTGAALNAVRIAEHLCAEHLDS
jgi:aspartate-semialdehyde dehydrogenase